MSFMSQYIKDLEKLYAQDQPHGFVESYIPGVRFFWSKESVERAPLLYEASLVIIGQGRKMGYLGDDVFQYDPDHYLMVSMAVPFECETFATEDEPLFGIFIDIDLAELHEMVENIALTDRKKMEDYKLIASCVAPVLIESDMKQTLERLIKVMLSKGEASVLGRSLVREVMYRALLGAHGHALYALTQQQSDVTKIARSLAMMREKYHDPISVDMLASHVGMSVSVFHRAFKRVTGHSPLQYLKKLRLSKAKALIIHEGVRAGVAGVQVGYESASQFNREFKRYFGVTPLHAREKGYENSMLGGR